MVGAPETPWLKTDQLQKKIPSLSLHESTTNGQTQTEASPCSPIHLQSRRQLSSASTPQALSAFKQSQELPQKHFYISRLLENNLNTMLSCQIKCLHGGFGSAWSSLALPWADPPHLLAARVRGQVLVFQYGLGQEITLKKRKKNTKTTERERESNRYIPVLRVNQESKIRNNLCFKMWSTECIMMAALARSNKGCFLVVLKQCCSVHQNAIYSTKLKTSVVPYLLTFIP